MRVRIRVEYIDFRGVKHQKTITKEVPDFEEKIVDRILSHKLKSKITVSVDQQVVEYLDNNSFGKEFMTTHCECSIVVNYWVANRKKVRDEKEDIKNFVNKYIKDPQMQIDFVAIYSHMKKSLKGISLEKKLSICLSALIATYGSATEAYKNINSKLNTKFISDVTNH